MAEYQIQNHYVKAVIESRGAELKSLIDCSTREEFMWDADPKHWGSTSPTLFPFIGGLKNKEYRFEGNTYTMEKHGFVRHTEFCVKEQKEEEVWFSLQANEETLKIYPFHFLLEIGYVLENKKIIVKWRVSNHENKDMYFSIGGHPGIKCPRNIEEKQTDYALHFHQTDVLVSTQIGSDGLASHETKEIVLNNGMLPITKNMFDQDALIMENYQVNEITFIDAKKNPYIKVTFDTPIVGVWSAYGGEAPFICIEPWAGICDFTDFKGSLEERKWENCVKAGEIFKKEYSIEII